jgi:hypothetical protein
VKPVAQRLMDREGRPVAELRRRLTRLLSGMRHAAAQTEAADLRQQLRHFVKVTQR